MDETINGGKPAAVNLVLREPWGGECQTAEVHVGHEPALLVLTRSDDAGNVTEMLIDATGPSDVEELVEWFRNMADALEQGARLGD